MLSGHQLECVLWESYGDDLRKFVDSRDGKDKGPIVFILQFACVSSFFGNVYDDYANQITFTLSLYTSPFNV